MIHAREDRSIARDYPKRGDPISGDYLKKARRIPGPLEKG